MKHSLKSLKVNNLLSFGGKGGFSIDFKPLNALIMLPEVAKFLKEASSRTQIVATTQSIDLVDAFSDTPESVVVCEKGADGCTSMKRFDNGKLGKWLKEYSLGELWNKGHIGGNRW